MTQSVPLKIKARDIAFGFFGWVVFDTIAFLFLLFSLPYKSGNLIFIIIPLCSVIATLVLFVKKRIWICAGIVVAIIANFGVWKIALFSGESVGYLVTYPVIVGSILIWLGIH
jgi:hypothetical protein